MVDTEVRILLVTGPLRHRLYDRFVRLFWGHDGVRVIMDRRGGERRRRPMAADSERRYDDRRRRAPAWVFPPAA